MTAFKTVAEREPSNPKPRVELANLYFDAERYDDAIKWYGEALKLAPNDVNVSTDLGVCYYYTNQPDKALEQFAHSLQARSEARQDAAERRHREGVRQAGSRRGARRRGSRSSSSRRTAPKAQAAKRALDSLQSAHPPGGGTSGKPGA